MNDFTKEELQMIYLDMNHNILKEGILNVANRYINLRDKVESMIDNYCEHTHKQYYERVSLYECNDCHKVTL